MSPTNLGGEMIIFTYSLFCVFLLAYLYYVGHKSMHAGAIVIAMGTVAWGPYLQTADKYPHTLLLSALTKKVMPRYQEWITQSVLYMNTLTVMFVIALSVCILTFFGLTGGQFPVLYYALVVAMVIGTAIASISSMTIVSRLKKMNAAHNLMKSAIDLLNTRDEEQSSEEEESDMANFFSVVTDRETWDLLTKDEAYDMEDQS